MTKNMFWILTNALGWSIGFGLGFTLWIENVRIHRITTTLDLDFQLGDFLLALVIGCSVALLQSVFMYKRGISIKKWFVITFVGLCLGVLLTKLSGQTLLIPEIGYFNFFHSIHLPPIWDHPIHRNGWQDFEFGGPVAGAILGAMVALSQSLLFKKHLRSQLLWVITSAIALEIAIFITSVLVFFVEMNIFWVGASVGTIYGMITAININQLLESCPPKKLISIVNNP